MTLPICDQTLPPISRLEALPDVARDVLFGHIARTDRAALLQLARASPALYAPALTAAVRTAPSQWHALTLSRGDQLVCCCFVEHGVGSLGYDATASPLAVYLIMPQVEICPNCGSVRPWHSEVLGPIPYNQLRTLDVKMDTKLVAGKLLPNAESLHFELPHLRGATIILDHLDALGGIPATVRHLSVDLRLYGARNHVKAAQIARQLAELLAKSQAKTLCIKLDIPHFQYESIAPVVEILLVKGLPRIIESLSMRGVEFGTEQMGHVSLIHVPWPKSLQHIILDMGRDGSVGSIIARMLPSLAAARLPLKTLELGDLTLTAGPERDSVLSCLAPSLTSFQFRFAEIMSMPDPPLHDELHAMIQTLATKCPLLCSLQFELPEFSKPLLPLEAFAKTTMPLLHHLPLVHVGLVNVELGDNDESAPVFAALEKHVPRLRSLELTWDRENGLLSNALGPVLLQRLRELRTR